MANRHKIIMCSFRQVAHNPPQAVRPASFTCYAGSARLIWFRYASPFIKVSGSPFTARPTQFCTLSSASLDFYLFTCGGHGLACVLAILNKRFVFIHLRWAWLLFTSSPLKQGSGGVCNPAVPPPSFGAALKLLCFCNVQRVPPHYCKLKKLARPVLKTPCVLLKSIFKTGNHHAHKI